VTTYKPFDYERSLVARAERMMKINSRARVNDIKPVAIYFKHPREAVPEGFWQNLLRRSIAN